jgi:hypothetical protein
MYQHDNSLALRGGMVMVMVVVVVVLTMMLRRLRASWR